MASFSWTEEDVLRCCGSKRFSKELATVSPFRDLHHAIQSARDIWFDKIDVAGWLEAFAAHQTIGATSPSVSEWCKEEQSAGMAIATGTTLQELEELSIRYKDKFGFVFLICASGRSTLEILAELKKRYLNKPLVEVKIAAQEEMKIIELRLARLLESNARSNTSVTTFLSVLQLQQEESLEDISWLVLRQFQVAVHNPHLRHRSRHSSFRRMDVHLEMWKGTTQQPSFLNRESTEWVLLGSSTTNADGRSGQLMGIADHITPGYYRMSFDTGKYAPGGFFPYVSIVFHVRQRTRHVNIFMFLCCIRPFRSVRIGAVRKGNHASYCNKYIERSNATLPCFL